jgi:hypothetical protein
MGECVKENEACHFLTNLKLRVENFYKIDITSL